MPRKLQSFDEGGEPVADDTDTATVYSDISFMGRNTVAFSMGLRQAGAGMRRMPKSMAAFLPNIAATDEEIEASKIKKDAPISDEEAARMLEDYDGCPEEHPDCDRREEKMGAVEEMLRKEEVAHKALEKSLFDGKGARDSARSQREHTRQRIEDTDDGNLDLQTNIRRLKDLGEAAKASTEEQRKAIQKLQLEIDSLSVVKEAQETALANDGSNRSDMTMVCAPVRSRHPVHLKEAGDVGALPDNPQENWRCTQSSEDTGT
mmetsp:Transcript_55011/g.110509  ORF Transcript_55011/g.110509 Transcript_55011/m.110509 type:complete len:262 (+) Transcript_55011:54-839(+)